MMWFRWYWVLVFVVGGVLGFLVWLSARRRGWTNLQLVLFGLMAFVLVALIMVLYSWEYPQVWHWQLFGIGG